MPWIEAAVSHLGIRLIWIDSWAQAGLALSKMLGIQPGTPHAPVTASKKENALRKKGGTDEFPQ